MQTLPLDPGEERRVAALMRADRERLPRGPEPDEADLADLLADPEVAAEADRILAGEGRTILGIPFAPREERGE
jgi:hypothetical protein